jgi:hypothetical protein
LGNNESLFANVCLGDFSPLCENYLLQTKLQVLCTWQFCKVNGVMLLGKHKGCGYLSFNVGELM